MKSNFTLYFKSKNSAQGFGKWFLLLILFLTFHEHAGTSVNQYMTNRPSLSYEELTATADSRQTGKERARGRSCEVIFANTTSALIAWK